MKRIVFILATIALITISAILLTSCNTGGNGGENDPLYADDNLPDENGKILYSINVRTEGGMPLKRVTVAVYDKENKVYKGFAETDADGNASMRIAPSENYVAQICDLPDGYVPTSEEYSFNLAKANTKVKTDMKKAEDLTSLSLSGGSIMHDFELEDTNGNKLVLSELLGEYDCVLLNFWFINCPYCIMEFPELDKVAKEFGDKVKVIAINPVDRPAATKDYKDNSTLSFDMVSDPYIAMGFGFDAYPVSVVIDRYGMVAFSQAGALNEEYFRAIFENFTSDNYIQKVYTLGEIVQSNY